MLKSSNIAALAILAAIATNTVNAADKTVAQEKNTASAITVVSIPQARIDMRVKAAAQQGQTDSPELRKAIKDELINLEVISQEALKKGLDKQPEIVQQMEFIKQNVEIAKQSALANAFVQDYLKGHAISEDALKQEYEKLKQSSIGRKEYKVAHILVDNEKDANTIVAELKKKGKFDKIAKAMSKDPGSKAQGGELGWTNPSSFVQPFGEAIVKLSKGQISAPVQTQFGWHVIKLEDVRELNIPAYEEVKANLEKRLQQVAIQEAVKSLRKDAKID